MKKLFTGRWLVTHGVVLLVLLVFISLGVWQLRRLEERRAFNNNLLKALDQPAIPLTGEPADPELLHFKRVAVTGTFDNAQTIALRNQMSGDTPGLHLVTPLRISGSNQAVLVDRGWIPRGLSDPDPASFLVYDAFGEVSLDGVAYRTQTRSGPLSPIDPPLKAGQDRLTTWFRIDIDRIQEQVPYPLLPIFISQLPHTNDRPDRLPRPEGVSLDEGPHLGYALQWFTFAGILVITYSVFLHQELGKDGR
jgi:surfeit locus 1 family protein